MNPERLAEIEAHLIAKYFPFGGFAEVCELVGAVREGNLTIECQLETIESLRRHELWCCPACGFIDRICQIEGFWEKGNNEQGDELHDCSCCDSRVVIRPATLADYHEALRERHGTTPPC